MVNSRNFEEKKVLFFISIAEAQPLSADVNPVNLVMNFITTTGTE